MRIKLESALLYAAVYVASAVFFELNPEPLLQEQHFVLPVYILTAVVASLFGYGFASWYVPMEGKPSKLDAALVPLTILVLTFCITGLSFGLVADQFKPCDRITLLDSLSFGLHSSFTFLYISWPVTLTGLFCSTALLFHRGNSTND